MPAASGARTGIYFAKLRLCELALIVVPPCGLQKQTIAVHAVIRLFDLFDNSLCKANERNIAIQVEGRGSL